MKSRTIFKSFVTLGNLGYLKAPGTWGSLIGLIFLLFLNLFIINNFITFLTILFILVISVILINVILDEFDSKDPKEIIIDEFLGIIITFYSINLYSNFNIIIIGFLLFRFFDITKILGISYIEDLFSYPWAIMLDDVAAGIISNLILQIILL